MAAGPTPSWRRRRDFDLMFIHLPNPDLTGHAEGWMSPPYLAKVAEDLEIDRHIPWMVAGPTIRKHVVVDRRIETMDTAATSLRLPVAEAFAD
jgi:hypothetical protein